MANFTKTSTDKLSDDEKKDLRWRYFWIAGREYYRVNNPGAMSAYDEIASKSYNDPNFDDGNADLNAYLKALGHALTGWLPGWNDTAVSFDQKAYACFASVLSSTSAESRNETLDQMAKGEDPGDFPCVNPAVETDPIYGTNFPGDRAPGSTQMWPWLVGIGAIGVVGAAIFFDQKKLKSKKNPGYGSNPTRKVKPFKNTKGNYLTLIGTESGDLILRPTRDGKKRANQLLNRRKRGIGGLLENENDMLSDVIANKDWDWIYPEEVGALTSATMIASGVERDDHGKLLNAKRVYAHMNYQVEDPTETWAQGKDVFYQGSALEK